MHPQVAAIGVAVADLAHHVPITDHPLAESADGAQDVHIGTATPGQLLGLFPGLPQLQHHGLIVNAEVRRPLEEVWIVKPQGVCNLPQAQPVLVRRLLWHLRKCRFPAAQGQVRHSVTTFREPERARHMDRLRQRGKVGMLQLQPCRGRRPDSPWPASSASQSASAQQLAARHGLATRLNLHPARLQAPWAAARELAAHHAGAVAGLREEALS
mmetsp:Transcript_111153/g.265260  ORF Transcript_111153/g.265260 Transcript_111153/m.265260 type:complete len:213 (+) Transcript_111153:285-923(+)